MFKKDYILLIFIVFLWIFLFIFLNNRNASKSLLNSDIVFESGDNLYITHTMVDKLLIQKGKKVVNISKDVLVLNSLEHALNQNQMIERSEVYYDIQGVLGVRIKQRTPIARVLQDSTSFYLDIQGKKMPLSIVHTARVPLVNGFKHTDAIAPLYALVKYIYQDAFLRKNIIGIHCKQDRYDLELRSDRSMIKFGKATRIENKFCKFKAFYQKANKDKVLGRYSWINLEYKNQVVCTKR